MRPGAYKEKDWSKMEEICKEGVTRNTGRCYNYDKSADVCDGTQDMRSIRIYLYGWGDVEDNLDEDQRVHEY